RGAGQRRPRFQGSERPQDENRRCHRNSKCTQAGENIHRALPHLQFRHQRGVQAGYGEHPEAVFVLYPVIQDLPRRCRPLRLCIFFEAGHHFHFFSLKKKGNAFSFSLLRTMI
ncbi:hypothetical protein V8G54_008489, partial [Vigna mungo]